jgi:WD40 repeat protein
VGSLLSAGEDGRIAHSQIVDGTLQPARPPELGTHPNFIRCLAPLPDGKIASAGYDGDIAIWDPLPT